MESGVLTYFSESWEIKGLVKNIQSIPQNQETIVASNSSLSAHLTSWSMGKDSELCSQSKITGAYSNNKMGSGLVNVSKPKTFLRVEGIR